MTLTTQCMLIVQYCIPYLSVLDSGVFSFSSNTHGFNSLVIFVKNNVSDDQLGSE